MTRVRCNMETWPVLGPPKRTTRPIRRIRRTSALHFFNPNFHLAHQKHPFHRFLPTLSAPSAFLDATKIFEANHNNINSPGTTGDGVCTETLECLHAAQHHPLLCRTSCKNADYGPFSRIDLLTTSSLDAVLKVHWFQCHVCYSSWNFCQIYTLQGIGIG